MEQTEGELERNISEVTTSPDKEIEKDWKLIATVDVKKELMAYARDEESLRYLIESCGIEVERRLSASDGNGKSMYEKIFGPFMRGHKNAHPETEVRSAREYLEDVLSSSAENRKKVYGKIFEFCEKECERLYSGKEMRLTERYDESKERLDSINVYIKDRE